MAAAWPARAQTTSWSVSTAADLTAALVQSYSNSVASPGIVNTISLATSISGTSQWIVDANVNIVGNGHTIDMQNADRAFFIFGGTVALSDLIIRNGNATGGAGVGGGGGGAGLGGAIFVGSGTYYGGASTVNVVPPVAALGISPPAVTLSGVRLHDNRAVGGASLTTDSEGGGGAGGMGGNGGRPSGSSDGAGGGGGFGPSAAGGSDAPGAAGALALPVVVPGGSSSEDNIAGGPNGGGGGGGGFDSNGGGGGLQAGNASATGGWGGFGGGGGGGGFNQGIGGFGGFGGGGGAGPAASPLNPGIAEEGSQGGDAGFGGGGGYGVVGTGHSGSSDFNGPGTGGFGGGSGVVADEGPVQGGGGLGAGGAVFVMAGASLTVTGGTFTGNTVASGSGINAGSAYGADLFSGANVAFNVAGGQHVALHSLGGAGNLADPNVSSNANDPNAQGGIIKTGGGLLTLAGTSFYSGATTIHAGTLALAAAATEQGTSLVTVGQNAGDDATLRLGSSSLLVLKGWDFSNPAASTDQPVMIAENAGSTGQVIIGSGSGSHGAFIAGRVFTGGAGAANVVFTQSYAAETGTTATYPFYTTLTGGLGLVQAGSGTTLLQPLYGPNTFRGGIVVNQGTLQSGSATAIPADNALTLNGGTLDLNGHGYQAASVTLSGGGYLNSSPATLSSPTVNATAGVIAGDLAADAFVKNGTGTVTITNAAGVTIGPHGSGTNSAFINSGTVAVLGASLSFRGPGMVVGAQSGTATLIVQDTASGLANVNGSQLILGADADSRGTVMMYANNDMPSITGGVGGGQVLFQGGFMYIGALDGNLAVVQDGPGAAALLPQAGAYTFTGGVTVNQGQLSLSKFANSETALPTGCAVTLNGGIFDLGGNTPTAGVLTLAGGTLRNSVGPQPLTVSSIVANSGFIAATVSGSGGLSQQGPGTTVISASTTFTGPTSVTSGTLVAAAGNALGGTSDITIGPGGVLTLAADGAVNPAATLTLGGGMLQTGTSLSDTFGVLLTSGTSPSTIDFLGNAATLTMVALDLESGGLLSIWNYSAADDFLNVTTGTALGDLASVRFYGDAGSTFLGFGGFDGTRLVPVAVPEPATLALLAASLVGLALRRPPSRSRRLFNLVGLALRRPPSRSRRLFNLRNTVRGLRRRTRERTTAPFMSRGPL